MSVPDRLRKTLDGFPGIRLAVLFGSVARGEATARGDVDLGVLLEDEAVDALWDIEIATGSAVRRPVDLIDLDRAPPLLRFQIARDGIALVERDTGAWTRFKTRAMLDWWDWAPTARQIHKIAAERLRKELDHGAA